MAIKRSAVLTRAERPVFEAEGSELLVSLVTSTTKGTASGAWDPPYATIHLSKAQTLQLLTCELGDAVRVAFEPVADSDAMLEIRVNGKL